MIKAGQWESLGNPRLNHGLKQLVTDGSTPPRMFYFYTNELHFAPEFLGRSQLVGSLASASTALAGLRLGGGGGGDGGGGGLTRMKEMGTLVPSHLL